MDEVQEIILSLEWEEKKNKNRHKWHYADMTKERLKQGLISNQLPWLWRSGFGASGIAPQLWVGVLSQCWLLEIKWGKLSEDWGSSSWMLRPRISWNGIRVDYLRWRRSGGRFCILYQVATARSHHRRLCRQNRFSIFREKLWNWKTLFSFFNRKWARHN